MPEALALGDVLGTMQAGIGWIERTLFRPGAHWALQAKARSGLVELAEQMGTAAAEQVERPVLEGAPRWVRRPARRWQALDRALQKRAQRLADWSNPTVQLLWTPLGVALSAAIAVALMQGAWLVGLSLLVVRVAGSAAAGGPARLAPPIDLDRPVRSHDPLTLDRRLLACLASHLCDVLVLAACSVALLQQQRTVWAVATMATVAVALWATLARTVSAAVSGGPARSPIERLFRTGGLLVALMVSAAGGEPSSTGVPALAIASLACAAYAALEMASVMARLLWEPLPERITTLAVDRRGRCVVTGVGPVPLDGDVAA